MCNNSKILFILDQCYDALKKDRDKSKSEYNTILDFCQKNKIDTVGDNCFSISLSNVSKEIASIEDVMYSISSLISYYDKEAKNG